MCSRVTPRIWLLTVAALLSVLPAAHAQWMGLIDRTDIWNTADYDFGVAGGGNENYYDGDFADYDGDGRMDRALISRYGLLWNRGRGQFITVSSPYIAFWSQCPSKSSELTEGAFSNACTSPDEYTVSITIEDFC